MRQLNRITLIGFVAHEPVSDVTPGGTEVFRIVVAVTDYALRIGRDVAPEFYRVLYFGAGAREARAIIRKGSYVYVEGAGHHSKYKSSDGVERFSFEVHASLLLRYSSVRDADATSGSDEAA